jgi:outer membrane protein insertion porin family
MIKKSLFCNVMLALLVLCFHWVNLEAQAIQYENQVIEKIDVEVQNLPSGANFDTKAVLSRIKTRQGDMFSHTDFDNDLKILAKEFDRVIPNLDSINGKMYITLQIWPKPIIRSIAFIGNERIKTSRLQKELTITVSSVYDRQAFNKAFHTLKAYYVKKGFFEAEIDYAITLDPLTNEVDIEIKICEGRAGKIKSIVFCGLSPQEEDDLIDMIVTKKYNFFLSWMTNEGTYNEEAVQHDQFTVLNYLQNEGYADATVEIKILEAKEANRIILEIQAEKGEKYFFGDITFEGNSLFPADIIRDEMTIHPGDPYSPEEIRETVTNITNCYGRQGYIETSVNFEPKLNCESKTYSLNLVIEEGEQYRVGLIKVYGNCSTQTKVILHEILLIPGEVFNIEKLQKTEERLTNIGYFKHVNVYAVKSEGPCGLGNNYRDINIEVEETSTGHFSTSFGFSSVESLFGSLSISEKNFNYKGLGCFWKDGLRSLRGGGEYLNLSATLGSKSRKYEISWTKPYFMDTQWTVGFDIDFTNNRFISNDYYTTAEGIVFHTSYQCNPFLRTGWHYRLRNTHVHVTEEDPVKNEKKLAKINAIKDPQKKKKEKKKYDDNLADRQKSYHQLKKEARHSGIVSAVGTTLYYDSTDHPARPRNGFKSRLSAEVAGVGGYHSFFGLSYVNTFYHEIDKRTGLKFRLDYRFLVPYGDSTAHNLPLDERLLLGGDTTVRGYRPFRLGPTFGNVKDDQDPSGGISLQYYSAEYNRNIFKNLDTFIFFDAGYLTNRCFGFGTPQMSAGYGIRLKLVENLPQFTFGMGYPLNPENHSEVKRFFFQMGGSF